MFRSRAGFWINAIYSPWLSFSEIASEWLNSYQKPELLMNFVNSWLAEPWREVIGRTRPDEIKALAQPANRPVSLRFQVIRSPVQQGINLPKMKQLTLMTTR